MHDIVCVCLCICSDARFDVYWRLLCVYAYMMFNCMRFDVYICVCVYMICSGAVYFVSDVRIIATIYMIMDINCKRATLFALC